MNLFKLEKITLHSGQSSNWKIECDALTDKDWETLAFLGSKILPNFGAVEGVPRGGLKLANALEPYITEGPLLIVDDVYTTGTSMKKHKGDRKAIGLVVFAREKVIDHWVQPIFSLTLPDEKYK